MRLDADAPVNIPAADSGLFSGIVEGESIPPHPASRRPGSRPAPGSDAEGL